MADGGDDGAVAAAGEALDGAGLAPTADDGVDVLLGPGSPQSAGGNGWFKQLVYAFIDAFKEIPVSTTLSMLMVSPWGRVRATPHECGSKQDFEQQPEPKNRSAPPTTLPSVLVAPQRRPSYAHMYGWFPASACPG